jgi:hypothetical protein
LNAARSRQNRLSEPGLEEKGNDSDGCTIDVAALGHIQLVTSLIEERWVGLSEIFAMLDKILRQHSIDFAGGLYRRKNPP